MEAYSRETALALAERAAADLAADPRVRLVYVFGSTVDDSAPRARDVDLAISTDPPLDAEEIVQLRASVLDRMSADLDLVSLEGASIVLAKEVADRGRCLYARSPEAETDFVVRARAAYWDFKPFLDVQWENAGKRLKERLGGSAS